MSFRFRPQLESLERRETPSPIGGEPVNPTDPSAPPSQTGDPTNPPPQSPVVPPPPIG